MEIRQNYKLPPLTLIGGTTHNFDISLFQDTGEKFFVSGIKSELSILNYGELEDKPLVKIPGTIIGHGKEAYIYFHIKTKHTLDLYGQYHYQISLKDVLKNVEVYQGDLTVLQNVSKDFLRDVEN